MIRFDWMPRYEEAGADGADGGGGKPAFDPAVFEAALMAKVDKTVNGVMARIEKMMKPKPEPEPKLDPEPEPKPEDKAKPDFKTKQLEDQLRKLNEKWEAAERKAAEAESRAKADNLRVKLREGLTKAGVDPKKMDDAYRVFKDDVRYSEDGEIIAGPDEAPLDAYIESVIQTKDYLLPPKQVGGAGAGPGGKRGHAAVSFDDLTPEGMKDPAKAAAARAAIANALRQQQQ